MITVITFVFGIAAITVSIVLWVQTVSSVGAFSRIISGDNWRDRLDVFIAAIIFGLIGFGAMFLGVVMFDTYVDRHILFQNLFLITMVIYIVAYLRAASDNPYPEYE